MIDPQKLVQIEIQVSELDRSLQFYEQVFGWERAPAEIHEYAILDVPSSCPFGISLVMSKAAAGSTNRLVLYYATPDPQEVIELAKAHGGAYLFGPKKLPGYGEVYQFADPDGQRWGLYKV